MNAFDRDPVSAPGRFYVEKSRCVGCFFCVELAPHNFCDGGRYEAIVYRQPATKEEEAACYDAKMRCPTWAIRANGLSRWHIKNQAEAGAHQPLQMTLVYPKLLCTDPEWESDSNVLLVFVHRKGTTLPQLQEMFPEWMDRRFSLQSVLPETEIPEAADGLAVQISSKNIGWCSVFSKDSNKPIDSTIRHLLFENRTSVCPVRHIGGAIGIAGFIGQARPSTRWTKRGEALVRLDFDGLTLQEDTARFYFAPHSDNELAVNSKSVDQRIFASFAPEDLSVVEMTDSVLRALAIGQLRWGAHYLSAGIDEQQATRREIKDADAMQLFWSNFSAKSTKIAREIDYAVSLRRERFIRPVYWNEPIPSPPEALARVHFARLSFPIVVREMHASNMHPFPLFAGVRSVTIEKMSYVEKKEVSVHASGGAVVATDHGQVIMGAQSMTEYKNYGQVGAMGDKAQSDDNKFVQATPAQIDVGELAKQLAQVRAEMKKRADPNEAEHDEAIGAIASAEKAANAGDGSSALKLLKGAGNWALKVAESVTASLVKDAIEGKLGV